MSADEMSCMVVVLAESCADESFAIQGVEAGMARAPKQQLRGMSVMDIVTLGASRAGRRDPEIEEATRGLAAGRQPSTAVIARLVNAYVQDALEAAGSSEATSVTQKKQSTQRQMTGEALVWKDRQKTMAEVNSRVFVKSGTTLERRVDGWDDVKEIADTLRDINELFVVITGLHTPQLLVEMIHEGVPFHCFVKLILESSHESKKYELPISEDSNEISDYWRKFYQLLEDPDNIILMKDVAIIEFRPNVTKQQLHDPSQMFHTQKTIFNEFLELLHYVSDTRSKHKHYLHNMHVINLENVPALNLEEMAVYNYLAHKVPPECADTSYLLDCMLQQVEQIILGVAQDALAETIIAEGMDATLELKLAINILNNEYDLVMESPSTHEMKASITILSEDEVAMRYAEKNTHVKIFDTHRKMLTCLCQAWSTKAKTIPDYDSGKTLQSFFQDMDCSSAEILLQEEAISHQIISTRYPPLRSIEDSDFRMDSNNANIPYNKCTLFNMDGMSTVYSDDKWPESCISAVSMNASTTLSAMFSAFCDYNCMDLGRCDREKLFLRFHSNRNHNGIHSYKYHIYLRTPIYLRDFYDFVLGYESDWFKIEEAKFQETLRKKPENDYKQLKISSPEVSTVLSLSNIAQEFVLIDSLKYQSMRNYDPIRETEKTTLSRNTSALKTTKRGSKDKSNSSTKAKSTVVSVNLTESADVTRVTHRNMNAASSKEPPDRLNVSQGESVLLHGYNLGPMRIQLSGRFESFSSPSGGSVSVDTAAWAYQENTLRLNISAQGHSLIYQPVFGNSLARNNFHVSTHSGIIIAFEKNATSASQTMNSKQSGQETTNKTKSNRPLKYSLKLAQDDDELSNANSNVSNNDKIKIPSARAFKEQQKEIHDSIECNTKISFPSGLVIETVYLDHSLRYIKQKYVNKHENNKSKEKFRCFLANGNVLKFMDDGSINVMCPDSRVFECTSVNNAQVQKVVTHEDLEEKKEPAKHKGKRKVIEKNENSKNLPKRVFQQTDSAVELKDSGVKEKFMQTFEYSVLTADGKNYTVRNAHVLRRLPDVLVRTRTDYETSEIFIRRLDGTNVLLKTDGTLISTFPDKTSITSCVTAKEIQFACDFESKNYTSTYIILDTTITMEHPEYARVKSSNNSFDIEMPYETRIKILQNGICSVKIKQGVSVEVENETVKFVVKNNKMKTHFISILYMNVCKENSSAVISRTTDNYGNEFEVKCDGTTTTSIHSADTTCRCFTIASDMTAMELVPSKAISTHIDNLTCRANTVVFAEPISPTSNHYFVATLQMVHNKRPWTMLYERKTDASYRQVNTCQKKLDAKSFLWLNTTQKIKNWNEIDDTYENNYNTEKVYLLRVLFQLPNVEAEREEHTPCRVCFLSMQHNSKIHFLPSGMIQDRVKQFLQGIFPQLGDFLQQLSQDIINETSKSEFLKPHFSLKYSVKKSEEHMQSEKVEYYKNILQKREFGCYFDTIIGLIFLTIGECIDRAVNFAADKNKIRRKGAHKQ